MTQELHQRTNLRQDTSRQISSFYFRDMDIYDYSQNNKFRFTAAFQPVKKVCASNWINYQHRKIDVVGIPYFTKLAQVLNLRIDVYFIPLKQTSNEALIEDLRNIIKITFLFQKNRKQFAMQTMEEKIQFRELCFVFIKKGQLNYVNSVNHYCVQRALFMQERVFELLTMICIQKSHFLTL